MDVIRIATKCSSGYNKFPSGNKFSRFMLYPIGQLKSDLSLQDWKAYFKVADPFMESYLKHADPSADFFLGSGCDLVASELDTQRCYWQSEFKKPFSSDFIIHLESRGSNLTSIGIFEIFPRIINGRRFSFMGREGPNPHFENVYRSVHATNSDRQEILERIRANVPDKVKAIGSSLYDLDAEGNLRQNECVSLKSQGNVIPQRQGELLRTNDPLVVEGKDYPVHFLDRRDFLNSGIHI